jgi:hypothetical protein
MMTQEFLIVCVSSSHPLNGFLFMVSKAIWLLATLVLPCSRHLLITCLTNLKLPIPSITLECSWSSTQIPLWNLLLWVDQEILDLCDQIFQSYSLFPLFRWNEDPKGRIQLVMMQHINLFKKEDHRVLVKIVEDRCDPSLFSYLGISRSRFL